MPSVTPCLGCGFELDADGYLVRSGETEKTYPPIINPGAGSFHYCDPVTQRSWDQPWNLPWGLLDEAVLTVNLVPATTPAWTQLVQMAVLYAPYRRMRLSGYVEYTQGTGFGGSLKVQHNGYTVTPIYKVTCGATSVIPVEIGVSGPNMGPWAPQWGPGQVNSDFCVFAQSFVGPTPTFVSYGFSVFDDGPASAPFYATAAGTKQRFWPTTLPY